MDNDGLFPNQQPQKGKEGTNIPRRIYLSHHRGYGNDLYASVLSPFNSSINRLLLQIGHFGLKGKAMDQYQLISFSQSQAGEQRVLSRTSAIKACDNMYDFYPTLRIRLSKNTSYTNAQKRLNSTDAMMYLFCCLDDFLQVHGHNRTQISAVFL